MDTIILAYHKPGDERGHELVRLLANRVSAITGTRVVTLVFEEIPENESSIEKCRHAFILTLARGGHYSEANHKLSYACSVVHGPIPAEITALHISSIIKRKQECPGKLAYHRAKRYTSYQERDYERIENLTNTLLESMGFDCHITLVPGIECSENECVKVSLLPTRDKGISILNDEPGFSLLTYWIAISIQ